MKKLLLLIIGFAVGAWAWAQPSWPVALVGIGAVALIALTFWIGVRTGGNPPDHHGLD